jgi:hypothetical protein
MDYLIAAAGLAFVIYWSIRYFWKRSQVKASVKWSSAEATIQSGNKQAVYHSRYGSLTLPCFAFTYVVAGEYFSGEFSLDIREENAADAATRDFVNRKFNIHYDPKKPEHWYIPDSEIDGYEVHQKLDPSLVELYPKD